MNSIALSKLSIRFIRGSHSDRPATSPFKSRKPFTIMDGYLFSFEDFSA